MSKSKLRMRAQLIFLLLPFILMSGVVAFGTMLPAEQVFARAVTVPWPAERVFETLANIEQLPTWSTRVLAVLPLPARDGRPLWRQVFAGRRSARLEVAESVPSRRLRFEIADDAGPFRATWQFDLTRAGEGTRVVLTERGKVGNAVSRFLVYFAEGKTRFAEDHLRDLGQALGTPVTVEEVAL